MVLLLTTRESLAKSTSPLPLREITEGGDGHVIIHRGRSRFVDKCDLVNLGLSPADLSDSVIWNRLGSEVGDCGPL